MKSPVELINVTYDFDLSWFMDIELSLIWYFVQIIGGGAVLYTISKY
jgi:hypothetical protein